MDRRIGALACLGLSLIVAGSGCRSMKSELPAGATYGPEGRQTATSNSGGGFNSEPKPAAMDNNSFGRNAAGSPNSAPGMFPPAYTNQPGSAGGYNPSQYSQPNGLPAMGNAAGDPSANMPPINSPGGTMVR